MSDLFVPQEIIPNEKTWYLISRDTKGKIRVAIVNYELIRELMSFGKDLLVLEPETIKNEVIAKISTNLEEYNKLRT